MTAFVICPSCRGTGYHDNLGDVTEMVHEDPDFAESYARGEFNVGCPECHGQNVVPMCDAPGCDQAAYFAEPRWGNEATLELQCFDHLPQDRQEDIQGIWEMEAMEAAERRMGA